MQFEFLLGSFSGEDIYSSIFAGLTIAIAFPIGALFAIFINYHSRVKADIAAFGAGIFFAAIAFSLVDESVKEGNVLTMVIGFIVGAIVFSVLNHYLNKLSSGQSNFSNKSDDDKNKSDNNSAYTSHNQEYKKQKQVNKHNAQNRPDNKEQPQEIKETAETGSSAKIVMAGLLLDSIPEALFVGILVALGHGGVVGAVSALFLGNMTTTMEGAKRMSESGMSVSKIMLRWSYVLLVVALSAPLGFYLVKPLTNNQISIILGFAAGILIAFITEELIPEAYQKANFHIGLSSTFGFLLGYVLFHFL